MKKVSLEVAKAIKEAGYPQDIEQVSYGYSLNSFGYFDEPYDYDALYNYHRTRSGEMICFESMCRFEEGCKYCVAPTYVDVWFWLWQEKKIAIEINHLFKEGWFSFLLRDKYFSTQEEAIEAAIEYLVDNDLIK